MEVTRVALKTWNLTCEGLVSLYLSPGSDTEPGRLMVKMQGWGLHPEGKDALVWNDCPRPPNVIW